MEGVGETGMRDHLVTITGVVIPIEWSDDHQVSGVAVAGWGETDYLIRNDDMGKELLKLLHGQVRVMGEVTMDEEGRNWIYVRSFQIVPSNSVVHVNEGQP